MDHLMELKYLTICADDYAMSPTIDAAIVDLLAQKRLQAVSCMTNLPLWKSSGVRLLGFLPEIELGLHLNLTHSMNAPNGSLIKLLLRSYTHTLATATISRLINQQLDAFEDTVGQSPSYIDGHQHIHQFPVIRTELLRILLKRYSGNLPWLRNTRARVMHNPKQGLIVWLGNKELVRMATQQGFVCNSRLLGSYPFGISKQAYRYFMFQSLASACSGDLLMCHPANAPEEGDRISFARQQEYEFLASNEFVESLEKNAITLMPLLKGIQRTS
ncbi:MAG: ChbG/HpnK family deacetylase [Gammaproteobacteria bacterium]|nr:ChbG/HpnK family deacetylase [Gammaproteobacteria bacterium]